MIAKAVGVGATNRPHDVTQVQALLNHYVTRLEIPPLDVDGECGHKTKAAIVAFQDDVVGMDTPDGRIDPGGRTWMLLSAEPRLIPEVAPHPSTGTLATLLTPGPQTRLVYADYEAAATTLGCTVPAIKAVAIVECAREAFDSLRRPTILYERHLFHRRTGGMFDDRHPDISNREGGGYGRFADQYPKLARAYELSPEAALEACSWGMFQLLGTNHRAAGHETVFDYVRAMCRTERDQLNAFVGFIGADDGLQHALRERDWATFARLYNGPQYHRNHYDQKMRDAYRQIGGV